MTGQAAIVAPFWQWCANGIVSSLQESHADTDARREALARFWDEVRLAQRALRPLISALESQLGEQLAPAAA